MTNQFSIAVDSEKLANAAAFLRSEGLLIRNRNELVRECVRVLADQAREKGVAVASDEGEGFEFLLSAGLAGDVSKAVKQKVQLGKLKTFTGDRAIAELVASRVRDTKAKLARGEKLGGTEAEVVSWLEVMTNEFEDEETALAALEKRFQPELVTEAVREKARELFKSSGPYFLASSQQV